MEGILKKVKSIGDRALIELTRKYNGVTLNRNTLAVSKIEIDEAIKKVPSSDKKLLLRLKKRIGLYHKRIKPCSSKFREKGITLGELWQPLERVGLYIPGGLRPLVSTLLMTACPAEAAGVKEIILATPPSLKGLIDPHILYTASLFGIKRIYKIGGAQAIAALAFGTETVPKVQKIAGPGNVYVTLAKKLLYGEVGIDLLAGPSEIVILADETAPAEYVALDLYSQAEHGLDSTSILISTSRPLIKEVEKNLKNYPLTMKHQSIGVSLIKQGVKLVNEIAPEHLEIITRKPEEILPYIRNAGAIFIGPYSPVALGDYAAGPSHVLPTSRTSTFSSGITTETFMKRTSFISSGKRGFLRLSKDARRLAEIEGLEGHKRAIAIRRDVEC